MSDSRVRVVVWLDAQALSDLHDIVTYRRGSTSRSALVREAVGWLLAKEAGWLLRARRYDEIAAARAEAEAALQTLSEREQTRGERTLDDALRIARGDA